MLLRLKTWPDNREFAATLTPLENQWAWISDCVAEQFQCDADDVGTLEANEECELDLITVKGEPVARIERKAGWSALELTPFDDDYYKFVKQVEKERAA